LRGSLLLSTAGVLITLMVVSVSVHLIVTMGELKWEAGREEGLVEGIGVFGLGGLLLAFVSLFGLAGMVWGRRGPRFALWLSVIPGVIGLLVAIAAAVVFGLNEGEEGAMAVLVPVAFALGPLLLLLGGLVARRLSKSVLAQQSPSAAASG